MIRGSQGLAELFPKDAKLARQGVVMMKCSWCERQTAQIPTVAERAIYWTCFNCRTHRVGPEQAEWRRREAERNAPPKRRQAIPAGTRKPRSA